MRDRSRRGPGAALGLALGLSAPSAHAYCRTTTCDAIDSTADCERDSERCSTVGEPLFWQSRCISYSVQSDGSTRGFAWADLDALVSGAFRRWETVDCGAGGPSVQIINLNETEGPADCSEPEYNSKGANANVWMFRDRSWPYAGATSTLAVTTVSFLTRTGQIVDADVELNTFLVTNFTTTDDASAVGTDLDSVITHEAGHFLGLAHTPSRDATMHDFYDSGTTGMRSLDADDVAGLCAIYPPDRKAAACSTAEPFGGFSPACNQPATSTITPPLTSGPEGPPEASCQCGVARRAESGNRTLAALALGVALLARGRRQKRA